MTRTKIGEWRRYHPLCVLLGLHDPITVFDRVEALELSLRDGLYGRVAEKHVECRRCGERLS